MRTSIILGFVSCLATICLAAGNEASFASSLQFFSRDGHCNPDDMDLLFADTEQAVVDFSQDSPFFIQHRSSTPDRHLRGRELCQYASCDFFGCFDDPSIAVCGYFCEGRPGFTRELKSFNEIFSFFHRLLLKREATAMAKHVQDHVAASREAGQYSDECGGAIDDMTYVVELTPSDGGRPVYARVS